MPYLRRQPRDFHDPRRTHRLYAGLVNARARQTGHLFQGRFGAAAMDEEHLLAAARYVALNPVRARLAERARAHLSGADDGLVDVKPLLEGAPRFADLLETDPDDPVSRPCAAANSPAALSGSAQFAASARRRLGSYGDGVDGAAPASGSMRAAP